MNKWYYDYVEETGSYHIFNTENDYSPYSFGSKEEAENTVNKMNKGER